MFCGTGKSRVMLECVDRAEPGSKVAIVTPSIALITQFAREYVLKYRLTERCAVMCICCQNELPRQDPGSKDILYTTDTECISDFLRQQRRSKGRGKSAAAATQLILVTYKSFLTFLDAVKSERVQLDLVMFDEAHHITAKGVSPVTALIQVVHLLTS